MEDMTCVANFTYNNKQQSGKPVSQNFSGILWLCNSWVGCRPQWSIFVRFGAILTGEIQIA
eukprot:420386-Amphidinium_carterae.1